MRANDDMVRSLHLIFALTCAILMSQFPAYHQQYLQRLGGALDEVREQIAALDERAAKAGMERYDYVRHFRNNPDPIVSGEGEAMVQTLARQTWLIDALDRLRGAPWYMILVEDAFHLDPAIARNTLQDFQPAVPLSISGGAHAFLGFFIGYMLPAVLWSLMPFRRARREA